MRFTYNHESRKRHGITIKEARYVHAYGKDFPMRPSKRGNDCYMVVGFPENKDYLIEIGVERISSEHEHLLPVITAIYSIKENDNEKTKDRTEN